MVKCSECGFLTFRRRETRALSEAELRTRLDGWLPSDGNYHVYETLPLCFRGERDFVGDIRRNMVARGKSENDAAAEALDPGQPDRQVIFDEIECSWFFKHVPGHTPKEHLDMLLFHEERAHQRQIVDDQRHFQSGMASDDRSWRHEESERQRLFHTRIVVIGGLLGILAAVVGASLAWWLTAGSLGG